MTVSSTDRTAGPFPGNGVTTAFPFTMRLFTAADIYATLTEDATGEITPLVLGSDFTVAVNGDQNTSPGGVLTMLAAPPTGFTLDFTTQLSATQGSELSNAGGFFPKVIENAFDKLTILLQQIGIDKTQLLRAPFPETLAALPSAQQRANKIPSFDTAGRLLMLQATESPATDIFVPTGTGAISRTVGDVLREVVRFEMFYDSNTTDHTTAYENWINEVQSSGRRGVARPGTFNISAPLTINVTGDIELCMSRGAIFRATSDVDAVMTLFLASTRDLYSVSIDGGVFDNSLSTYVMSGLSGGGLGLQKLWKFRVDNARFIGPADYNTGGSFGGDTGLTIVDCRAGSVARSVFSGQRDLGIYITGDSDSSDVGDGGEIEVSDCDFIKCAGGVAVKRQTQRVSIISNRFRKNYRDVMIVGTDLVTPDPPAGRRCTVSNNSSVYVAKNFLWVQTGGSNLVNGNRVQDFGYALDGTTPVASPTAFLFEGSSNNQMGDNKIAMQELARAGSHAGIIMQGLTYGGSPLTSIENAVANTSFQGLDIAIREITGEADSNTYEGSTFKDVTTKYSNLQTNSRWAHMEAGKGHDAQAYYLNGLKFVTFTLVILDNAGTLQHKIVSDSQLGASQWASVVSGASGAYQNTPTLSAVVDFTTGVGLGPGNYEVTFNVPDQDGNENKIIWRVDNVATTSATPVVAKAKLFSAQNVNGVTRDRVGIDFLTAASAAWPLAANLSGGKAVEVQVSGWIVG